MAAILKSNMADIERIPSGPISENVRNMLMYICAKFGACITKCTIGLLCCPTNMAGPTPKGVLGDINSRWPPGDEKCRIGK